MASSRLRRWRVAIVLSIFLQDALAFSPPHSLARRDDSCDSVDSNLSSSFKCSSDQTCVSLDSSSSAICCPKGNDCTNINPITCDISKQDVSKTPDATIMTTKLNGNLSTCGSQCCPFGYKCASQASSTFCTIDLSTAHFQGKFPGDGSDSNLSTTSKAFSASATSTQTSSPTANSAALSSGIDSTKPKPTSDHNSFPPGVFIAGFFPGVVVGVLMMLTWVICTGRHKKPVQDADTWTPSMRPKISEPILTSSIHRDDFLRRARERTKSMFSTKESASSDSNPWEMPVPPVPNHVPHPPPAVPITPQQHNSRERGGTMESIPIQYSPPTKVRHPSAEVSPLRAKLYGGESGLADPFQTPTRASDVPHYDNPAPESGERLTPQRYEVKAGPSRRRGDEYADDHSKRDTSFTALMKHCNIPDKGDEFPMVPPIPKPYETRLR